MLIFFLCLLYSFQLDSVNSTASTLRSEVQNGYEAPPTKTNLPTESVHPSNVPQKVSQFVPIDEQGSSFGKCEFIVHLGFYREVR